MARRTAFENLQRARVSLARARALFEAGRADPWQVADAQHRHDEALAAALDADAAPELALATDVPAVVRPAPPLDLAAVDLTLRASRRGRA